MVKQAHSIQVSGALLFLLILLAGCSLYPASTPGTNSAPPAVASQVPTLPPTPTSTSTPTETPAQLISGTWQGQGSYYSGQTTFDMTLVISASGNTFTGTLQENAYSSEVAISGNITISSGTTVGITFTDNSAISGSGIELGCTYTATVTNGQMTGFWHYPGDSSPDGALTLSQA